MINNISRLSNETLEKLMIWFYYYKLDLVQVLINEQRIINTCCSCSSLPYVVTNTFYIVFINYFI